MGGLGHDFKVGVNFINEPRLFITFNTSKGAIINTHLTNDLNGPISTVTVSDGDSSANIPTKQFAAYFQDDWRASGRLTVNWGVRYDITTGVQLDQSKNPNFVKIQAAGAAGKLAGIIGLENAGLEPREDKNNIQPRIGAVLDVSGNGKNIVRGGWGIYTDFGYTNSNNLFAAADATGSGFGNVFNVNNPAGIRNPDGSFYRTGQSLDLIRSQNQVAAGAAPLFGQWVDPRLEAPYSIQTNAGWSHELAADTVLNIDYVNSKGRDLNFRPRVNQRIPGTTIRRVSVLLPTPLSPDVTGTRPALSRGRSEYNGLITSVRRRMAHGVDFTASYTLQKGESNIGNASDELNTANIQDASNPFDAAVQFGPNRTTDARHLVSLSAVFNLPGGFNVAPVYYFRSALPVDLIDGRDLNLDGDATEIPAHAFKVTGFDKATGKSTIEDIGPCETVNCGRGWAQSQMNIRVSKMFRLAGRSRIEAMAEVFNLLNAVNPSNATTVNRRVTIPSGALAGQQDPTLLQPTTFSGDFRRPEQRVGQLGLRFLF
jgi:hypothetical protein